MNRSLKLRTLPALAIAMLLPLAANAAQGTAAPSAKTTPASKSTMHGDYTTQAKAAHKTHAGKAKHQLVDINTASKEEIIMLPGVTDQIADKIIAGRPFKTKAELVSKQVLTRAEYSALRGRVIAKHAQGAKSSENKAPESKTPETTPPESK